MRYRKASVGIALVALALVAAACSDVSSSDSAGGGATTTGAQCGDETITIAVNPWVGAAANANVAKAALESMGCTVELKNLNEKAQFPAMANDQVDATLEVWPSGHSKDREDYVDGAGTVVDGGELGITGDIGWFVPQYVIDENPQYASWEGFKDNADTFATAETGDQGRFLGADTTYSIFDEQIIESLGLDLKVVYSGSEDASLAALDTAVKNHEPILMYWWTPQWANAKYDLTEVKLPAYTQQCADIALNDPEAKGYNCDYADDTLYKAFSSKLETKDPAAFQMLSNFNWTADDQNEVALAIQDGTDPEQAAQDWIDQNQDTVQSWMPASS
jgi:glycine betaine/proline transport system substrate-binding protein